MELDALITDLALILIVAGGVTLLFKKLKQPVVLGYIVAGFLVGPNFVFFPTIVDEGDINLWAELGIIVLLFSLGLEFSFKKLFQVGASAVLTALVVVSGMMLAGYGAGRLLHFTYLDSIFLGAMLSMSSTTIIIKAFTDLNLRKKAFTNLVFGVLIVEDLFAVVMMVILSSIAVKNSFEGAELLESIAKLVFFLIIWFVVGISILPLILKKTRKFLNDETLLVVSMGLCLGMVVLATYAGFSSALGAFVMGSILAGTNEAERIEKVVQPVKDLFGAIFFVSVGMLVSPAALSQYALPICLLSIVVIVGQIFFGTVGMLASGQTLKISIQSGFSLSQIGEFAFIIASLGVSLHVTSDFLYPIVVAVSVITTFLTPYMIRLAEPASTFVDAHLPESWRKFLMRYSSGSQTALNHENLWKKLLIAMVRITVVYSIVSISIIALSFRFVVPFFKENLPHFWASLLGAVFVILCIAPFLRAIMVKKNHSVEFVTLWHDSRTNRAPLVSTIVIRIMIAALFVIFVISGLFKASIGLIIGVAVLVVLLMVWSRRLKKQSILIERRFFQNLRSRDVRAEYLGEKKPEYAGRLLSHDLHLADMEIPGESSWAGKTLLELNLGKKFGVHVASILRGKRRINIPGGSVRLFPMDKIQVIGTDEQLSVFNEAMQNGAKIDWDVYEKSEMALRQFIIDADSVFLGKTIRESGIRDKYHCMIAGIENEDGALMVPDVNVPLVEGDVVWVVGEKEDVYQLIDQKSEKVQVG